MIKRISRLKYFLSIGMWKEDDEKSVWWKRWLLSIVRRFYMAVRLFVLRGHIDYATQLSFSMILAIVPIFSLIFAIGRGFGLSVYIEHFLRDMLSSQPAVADTIIKMSDSYLQHAQTGIFIGIGLLFMLYSVLRLIYTVESVFDSIWQVKHSRTMGRIVADYTSMVFLVPVMLIVMSGLSIIANTTTDELQQFLLVGPIAKVAIKVLPLIALTIIFMLLFTIIPNTKVKLSAAFAPSVMAAIAMLLVQWCYVHGQMLLTSYNAIYGSLAALPLFMLWLQFSWYICLFFAELCYMNQYLDYYEYTISPSDISEYTRRKTALMVMKHVIDAFKQGHPAPSVMDLKTKTQIPIRIVSDVLHRLESVGLISQVGVLHDEEIRYQPSQSVDRMPYGRIAELLDKAAVHQHKNRQVEKMLKFSPKTQQEMQQARQQFIERLNKIHDL